MEELKILNKHKNESLTFFYYSINKDLRNWKRGYSDKYISPTYNNIIIILDNESKKIYFSEEGRETVIYKWTIIPFKIFKKYRILKKHFNRIKKEEEREEKKRQKIEEDRDIEYLISKIENIL